MAKVLVTPALPYANGSIHIGHLVEHLQVNTYVRALRMAGDEVLCVCGADCHGAPIEIAALKAGKKPEELARENQESHGRTFARFHIEYDGGYGSTHTDENRRHAERIYQALKDGGHLRTGEVEQLQDPTDGRFLADRFVKGTCPKCKTPDQYGDSCEACGSTYRATELIDPKSVITGATPVLAKSTHIFVKLGDFADRLKALLAREGVLHASQRHFLDTWFADGLKDWDVSRDGPYFGFPIPGETNKFFYVWLDAPIGYVSLTERALAQNISSHVVVGGGLGGGLGAFTGALYDGTKSTWQDYWKDPSTRIEHFIGKDILYFHTLFWPAMLMAAGDTLPSAVHVHGMLTVNGTKMSKSRGTFINADDLAELCDPQALRYYYAAKLGAEPNDIDLSFEDFVNRVNADLVNNVVNLVSRTVPQLHKVAGGRPAPLDENDPVVRETRARLAGIAAHYRALDFAAAVRTVVEVGSVANKLLQDTAPWDLAKSDPEAARKVLTTALWVGKCCLACLKPVVPALVEKLEGMLKLPPLTFGNALAPLPPDLAIGEYVRLFERLDLKKVASVVKPTDAAAPTSAPSSAVAQSAKPDKKKAPPAEAAPPAEISIDEFMKVELRAAKVLSATAVEGSDKLIAVKLDVGELGARDIFAGLRPHVAPEALVGRMVVVVANLAPRKMKFGTSFGMMLAAGEVPVPLSAEGAKPGERIR
ncbi:MAG: methionine--tRNA ligase [Deltaproteobacteria bacterium]|nr:methionine--tRNA ligase [Deltaproteobacteria bacterium]